MERSTTYLLKVWQAAGGGFRAHLRAVDQETALAFDDTQALAAHLAAAAQPGPAPKQRDHRPARSDDRRALQPLTVGRHRSRTCPVTSPSPEDQPGET